MTDTLPILCAGSALWDIIARTDRRMRPGFDVPGKISRQLGGVALNVALALARREAPVALLSAVGEDAEGAALLAEAALAGIDCTHVARTADPTDSYLAIEDPLGEVFGAVADCALLERQGAAVLSPLLDGRLGSAAAPWAGGLVVDGNFPQGLLDPLADAPAYRAARIALVPASPGKAGRLARAMTHPGSTLYVNRIEAEILCEAPLPGAAEAAEALLARGAARVVVTDSHRPAAAADADGLLTCQPPQVTARTTTGAGDAFLAAHLDASRRGADPRAALEAAVAAAAAHISHI
ncbi:kinase [Halovulum dunhuangense]|uniref:Kinase n=1 Tax=Halovulum dunhuangense TaxID=1505036 RepID=A0A849L3D6_9RHOB|nr:PfkB family carbohydrate kinase [Halovulum dunhuangense]NNU80722.1 kinase [Halovulum dunhuangense]